MIFWVRTLRTEEAPRWKTWGRSQTWWSCSTTPMAVPGHSTSWCAARTTGPGGGRPGAGSNSPAPRSCPAIVRPVLQCPKPWSNPPYLEILPNRKSVRSAKHYRHLGVSGHGYTPKTTQWIGKRCLPKRFWGAQFGNQMVAEKLRQKMWIWPAKMILSFWTSIVP